MSFQVAQQYLGRYRAAQMDMARAERLIKKTRELLEVQGVNTSSERVQSSIAGDRTANLIAELVDARHEFEEALERSLQVLRDINVVIENVSSPQQKRLLELRYIEGKTWEEISNTIHVTYRHVFRVRNNALAAVEEILCGDE